MKFGRAIGSVVIIRTESWLRVVSIGLFIGAFLVPATTLDAKGKPPDNPAPPPVLDGGVIYYMSDQDGWLVKQIDPDGSNHMALFETWNWDTPTFYGYCVVPSQGVHNGSRLFACSKHLDTILLDEEGNPIMDENGNPEWKCTYNGLGGDVYTALILVDEAGNEVVDLMQPEEGDIFHVMETPGICWYAGDTKIMFYGMKFREAGNYDLDYYIPLEYVKGSSGLYVIDISFDGGPHAEGAPQLIPSSQEVLSMPGHMNGFGSEADEIMIPIFGSFDIIHSDDPPRDVIVFEQWYNPTTINWDPTTMVMDLETGELLDDLQIGLSRITMDASANQLLGGNEGNLVKYDFNTKQLKTLYSPRKNEWSEPVWSPEGTNISCIQYKQGIGRKLLQMTSDGEAPTVLVEPTTEGSPRAVMGWRTAPN